ncbi:glycoside hydrolase [Brachybacterium sacelli]|uniref:Glycoside hydrolase n=1 Tax=Brachybacterium sacelli TaxID=173364 RepID=A0ABS4WYK3_9MICO|nr:glycoside hydrolase [Brachybacterium sacelli]MBP2381270.1 hypothetical protein [Brachybacterium sacelli]
MALISELSPHPGADTIGDDPRGDLSGQWAYRLDREGIGEEHRWFAAPLARGAADGAADAEHGHLDLPGSLQEQGIGDPVTVGTPWTGGIVDQSYFTEDRYAPYRQGEDVSVPFWLQPRMYYRGAAWFQREIQVPDDWDGRSVILELERVHWESTVWVDGTRIGAENSLSTAHRHDLGRLAPGTHLLTVRVDNRTVIDVGPNSHAVSDHTQGNWNGIIGRMQLHARSEVEIAQLRAFPDVAHRRVQVRIDIGSGTAGVGEGSVSVRARRLGNAGSSVAGSGTEAIVVPFTADHGEDLGSRGLLAGCTHLDIDLELGEEAALWDEFDPALYELEADLVARTGEQEHRSSVRTVLGLREVGVDGTQVSVNGRRTFLRGSLECCVFPLTGYPPTDLGSWRRIVRIAKEHGLNLLRMHSWCPPEAAFLAADEAGLYLQVEGPIWANQGAAIGEGRPVDAYLHEETRRILREFGNHPSFVMMAHGNEPAGRDAEFLASWVRTWHSQDPRRLYTSAAGWPAIEENDVDNIPDPRAHRWGEGLDSRLNDEPPNTRADYADWVSSRRRPVISHEIGQWCVYPDFEEVSRYTGVMQPRNFGIFADFLREAGMEDQAADFLDASGRLQTLCYKEEIESALRTDGFGGFHLLGLTDFPGQGTALVGVLNPFWESKGYCTAEEFSRFCGPTVPLARLDRRVWRADEEQAVDVQVAHFGPEPIVADVRWSLRRGEAVLADGTVASGVEIGIGNGTRLGPVTLPAGIVDEPAQLNLALTLEDAEGGIAENDWDVWIYPEPAEPAVRAERAGTPPVFPGPPASVRSTDDLEEAAALAATGNTVLFEVAADAIGNEIALGFTPVFWNTAWTRGQAPHTLGLLHDPEHPLFELFPTEGATNWQWWAALHGSRPMLLDGLPVDLRPAVQVIDTWFEARRLGALFEARLGQGRIIVTSLNLTGGDGASQRLAARQLRRSILSYMASSAFDPQTAITPAQLRTVLR